MITEPIQFDKFRVPYHSVLVRLGYLSGKTKLTQDVEESIKEEIALAEKIITPRRVIAESTILLSSNTEVSLEPGLLIQSRDIFELLKDCVQAYGFAVTIGKALEEKRDAYIKEKRTAKAAILDAIGSAAAEELANITNSFIVEQAGKNNYSLTRRYSPGYGDWNVAGQEDFIRWLGAKDIGITLNNYYQMLPEKSVSAILGAKPK